MKNIKAKVVYRPKKGDTLRVSVGSASVLFEFTHKGRKVKKGSIPIYISRSNKETEKRISSAIFGVLTNVPIV